MERTTIENIIATSLEEISLLVTEGKCRSRIIMPFYRTKAENEDTIRYSEQELKQIFLNLLCNNTSFFYSVETPSEYVYSFSNSDQPQIKKLKEEDDHYESARFDVSLYNTANPKDLMCHIEFKHENADEKEIGKDLLKLTNEFGNYNKNFFVHYIVRKSNQWITSTFPSVIKKYRNTLPYLEKERENFSKVWVYLMFNKKDNNPEKSILIFSLQDLSQLSKEPSDEECFRWKEMLQEKYL